MRDGAAKSLAAVFERLKTEGLRGARWLHGLSLRARLLALTIGLAAIGLTVAGVVTYGSLRSFLTDRVDRDLRAAQRSIARGGGEHFRAGPGELPRGTAAAFVSADEVLQFNPRVDAPLNRPAGYSSGKIAGHEYRFLVSDAVGSSGPGPDFSVRGTLIVGVPLDDVNGTLDRLLVVEILVGLGALGAIGGLGFVLIRLGLRPLGDIETTAAAIAGGDLSRRIDDAGQRTEVGRLGSSLNTMLGTIEESFKEREESERRLRQFVADASHELQTPLTSVRGYAELFRRGAADRPEDLATAMRRIEAESERMGELVDDLLLLARLDQGRPMERELVDLVAITRDLVGDARVVDPDRPIELLADDSLVLEGDRLRLEQVVTNLLSNARTHTPVGTQVIVSVRRQGDSAVLEVADHGLGMPPHEAARVFERFFRADVSRARASGGTGLGLSIVAAIAEAHGGRVEVETAPGDGARFRVTLPVAPPAALTSDPVAGDAPA